MEKEDVTACLLTHYLRSVPNVVAELRDSAPEPYLADIVQMRPDILCTFPELMTWFGRTGHNMGWKTSEKEMVRL